MNCPACNKTPSFTRVSFTLQGVSFSKSMKGYSRCEQCGQLLRVSNLHLPVIAQTVAGVASVGLYAIILRSLVLWIGLTNALILFFPYLLIVGIFVSYVTTTKFGRLIIVQENDETTEKASQG